MASRALALTVGEKFPSVASAIETKAGKIIATGYNLFSSWIQMRVEIREHNST
jgi:hypothetical protein